MTYDVHDRFWSKVDKSGDCWLWTGSRSNRGYGRFWLNGTLVQATHYAYESEHEPLADGLIVCHSCDEPSCVRPSHLFAGSHQDNVDDKVAKGRHGSQIKTHCKHGHEFTPDNTYIEMPKGARRCRECRRAIDAKRRVA